jgi:ADP-ribose pyrophosphatase YjhB (NUDIX family)
MAKNMDKNPAIVMSKEERERIVSLFAKEHELSFTAIEKATCLRSNHLVYFLKQLQEEGIVEKRPAKQPGDAGTNTEIYALTARGEHLIPHMQHLTGKENPPLAVVLAAIVDGKRICLLKRAKRPFQGHWGLVGGKLRADETIMEAAIRETQEETGLRVKFDNFCGFCHEHVREKGAVKHSFLLFVCRVSPLDGQGISATNSNEGDVAWFDFKTVSDEKLIPSDRWFIENMIGKKAPLFFSSVDDDGKEYVFEAKKY